MRIKEIITEGGEGSLQIGVSRALPATYALTQLTNQDPYYQYRMGLALAKARAYEQGLVDGNELESVFGERMIVVARSAEEQKTIDLALKMMGERGQNKKLISTAKSEENPTVNKTSPLKPQPPVQRKNS